MPTTADIKKADLDVGLPALALGGLICTFLVLVLFTSTVEGARTGKEFEALVFFGGIANIAFGLFFVALWRRLGVIIKNQHDIIKLGQRESEFTATADRKKEFARRKAASKIDECVTT